MSGRQPITALDVLAAIQQQDALAGVIQNTANTLLNKWRTAEPEATDRNIFRAKMTQTGWKWAVQEGLWFHPAAPDYPAPDNLQEFADMIARHLVMDTLAKDKKDNG